jgi:hypothetical protein
VFSFFVYAFQSEKEYSSLQLRSQHHFRISPEYISPDDIRKVLAGAGMVDEPEIPFPQADRFDRVVDLLGLLVECERSESDITQNYNFDQRQTLYYTSAGRYLGLIGQSGDRYFLTAQGEEIMRMPYKRKYMALVEKILRHRVFREVVTAVITHSRPVAKYEVVQIMKECGLYRVSGESTYWRRAQTVIKWVEWILNLQNDYKVQNLFSNASLRS